MADGSHYESAAALLRTLPMSLWPQRVLKRRQMLELAAHRAEEILASLIEKIDLLSGDPDLEPSLGAHEHNHHLRELPPKYFLWCDGATDERELEETDQNFGGIGDRTSQKSWGTEGGPEGDDDPDCEASLGASIDVSGQDDQAVTWGSHASEAQCYRVRGALVEMDDQEHDGREPQCEDEGAACEDEGAQCDDEGSEEGDAILEYHPDDQRLVCVVGTQETPYYQI